MNEKPFKYFSLEEIGVNKDFKWTPEIVSHGLMMDDLREWAVKYFPKQFAKSGLIVSKRGWFRNKEDNKAVGGASNSAHLDARATDVNNIPSDLYREFIAAWKLLCHIYGVVGGIELYNWGMHFDSHSDKFKVKTFRLKDNRGVLKDERI